MFKQELRNMSYSLSSLRTYEIGAGVEYRRGPLLLSIWLLTSENILSTTKRKSLKM